MEEIKEILDKLNNRISNLEFKVANLELKETEDTVNDEWIPNECEIYYFVDLDYMEVDCCRWNNGEIDNIRLNHKTIFETRKEADEYLEYLQEKEKYMNTFTEEEWENNNIDKWYYIYCYENKTIVPAYKICYKANTSYFRTREEVEQFINKYEWQIKYELGVN